MTIKTFAEKLRKKDWFSVVIELLIVIIGILIAIQVDNWNEQRKNLQATHHYYQRLLEDIVYDKGIIERRIEYYQQVKAHAQNIVTTLDEPGNNIDTGDINRAKNFLIDTYQATQILGYRESSDTYEELLSTGKIDLIANEDIRKSLARYYRETKVMMPYWLAETDLRDLVRRRMPFDIQRKIQSACELDILKGDEQGAASLIDQCHVELNENDISRAVSDLLLLQPSDALSLRLSANRQISNLSSKLNIYEKKLESAKKLIAVMQSQIGENN